MNKSTACQAFYPSDNVATLERALAIAATAHEGQLDKGGSPYILHPIRVMLRVDTVEERIAAIMHDVVEDSDVTLDSLRSEGFSDAVLNAIHALTKRPGEKYEDFIDRSAADPIAREVKLADLAENSDLTRIPAPTAIDHERIARYRRAIDRIEELSGD